MAGGRAGPSGRDDHGGVAGSDGSEGNSYHVDSCESPAMRGYGVDGVSPVQACSRGKG